MNGGDFGGNTNLVIQKNLFALNVKFSNSEYELNLGQQYDGSGVHQNVKVRNNVFFMRKKNKDNQNISLYNTSNRAYVSATDNDLYYLEPTANTIPVSFLGQLYTYNALISLVSVPIISVITVNDGTTSTTNPIIRIYSEITKSTPAYYMASENANFSGASWMTYNSTINFTLSADVGLKTVYFKVINAAGESTRAQVSIQQDTVSKVLNSMDVPNYNSVAVSIYPNPVTSLARVSFRSIISAENELVVTKEDNYEVTILSLTGNVLEQSQRAGVSFNLDFSRFPVGIYLVKIKGVKNVFTKTVVKN